LHPATVIIIPVQVKAGKVVAVPVTKE